MSSTGYLTTLRFFAAAIVVIFHFGRSTDLAQRFPPLQAGPPMVTFFFVLSGFVLTLGAWHRPPMRIGEYGLARFSRIYPLYVLALLWAVFLHPVSFNLLLLDLSLLQAFIAPHAMTGNGPGWSISVEAFLYAVFPFLITGLSTLRPHRVWVIGAALLSYLLTQALLVPLRDSEAFMAPYPNLLQEFVYYHPVTHLHAFLLGVAAAYGLLRGSSSRALLENSMGAFLGALVVLGGIFFLLTCRLEGGVRLGGMTPFYDGGFMAPFYALFLSFSLQSRAFFDKFLGHQVMVSLGKSSYALFLFQVPMHDVWVGSINPVLGFQGDIAFWSYFALLVGFSLLMHGAVEEPLRRALLRRTPSTSIT